MLKNPASCKGEVTMAVLRRALLRENFHLRLASAQHLAIWGMVSPAGAGEPRLPGGPRTAKSPKEIFLKQVDSRRETSKCKSSSNSATLAPQSKAHLSKRCDRLLRIWSSRQISPRSSRRHMRGPQKIHPTVSTSLRLFHLLDNIII